MEETFTIAVASGEWRKHFTLSESGIAKYAELLRERGIPPRAKIET